jgi:hypothetical protein
VPGIIEEKSLERWRPVFQYAHQLARAQERIGQSPPRGASHTVKVGSWHWAAHPGCQLPRRVLEGKQTILGRWKSGADGLPFEREVVTDRAIKAWYRPLHCGFVASFARPGGNVTGFIFTEPTMAGKWLELLKEIAPRVARVAMLFNPVSATYAEYWLNPFKAAAASFAVEAIATPVRDRSELESVIAAQARAPNGGLIAMPDSFTDAHRVEITSLAARYLDKELRTLSRSSSRTR